MNPTSRWETQVKGHKALFTQPVRHSLLLTPGQALC